MAVPNLSLEEWKELKASYVECPECLALTPEEEAALKAISRCEGACAIAGELRMEGNGCDMIKEIEERAKLEKSHQPTIVKKDHEQCH